jgi:hypothetical protein
MCHGGMIVSFTEIMILRILYFLYSVEGNIMFKISHLDEKIKMILLQIPMNFRSSGLALQHAVPLYRHASPADD